MKKLVSKCSCFLLLTTLVVALIGCKPDPVVVLLPGDAGEITQTVLADRTVLLSIDEISMADTYRWYRNNEEIQNTTARTYTAAEDGSYKVAGVNTDGEGKASPISVVTIYSPNAPADAGEITQQEQQDGAVLLSIEAIDDAHTYRWYKDGEVVQDNEELSYLATESGEYKVSGINEDGVEGKASPAIDIVVYDTFNILTEDIIEDVNLRLWIFENIANGQDVYTNRQAAQFTGEIIAPSTTRSLKGLEYFTSFTTLTINECIGLASPLDLTAYKSLTKIQGEQLSIQSIKLDGLDQLRVLNLSNCGYLSELDITSLSNLEELFLSSVAIPNLDFGSVYQTLRVLKLDNSGINGINLKQFSKIENIDVSQNNIESLDVSGITTLKSLTCSSCKMKNLSINNCPALETVIASFNELTSLDTSGCTSLASLYIQVNDKSFSQIDLTDCKGTLINLGVGDLGFTSFDLKSMNKLEYFSCASNPMNGATLDLSDCVSLKELRTEDCCLGGMIIENCTALESFYCYNNEFSELKLPSEMPNLTLVYIGQIEELSGSIDFGDSPMLKEIHLYYNQITEINVSGCPSLEIAYFWGVGVSRLDVSNNPNITYLGLSDSNNLTQVKVWSTFDMDNIPDWAKWDVPATAKLVYEFE